MFRWGVLLGVYCPFPPLIRSGYLIELMFKRLDCSGRTCPSATTASPDSIINLFIVSSG
jgi:hypothetical protein